MLKIDALSAEVRELFLGNRTTVKRFSPHPSPSGGLLRNQVSNNCLLKSALCFSGPVVLTSVSVYARYRPTSLVVLLSCDNHATAVQMACDLRGEIHDNKSSTQAMTFLSPVGLGSRDEYILYVCQHRTSSSSQDETFEFARLEITYFAAESQSLGFAPDPDSIVSFEVDGQTLEANKFVLAAKSSVFKAQFFGECLEATTGVVKVDDFSYVGFEFFLSLLADTSSDRAYQVMHCTPPELDLVEVCALADKYCASTARNIAEAAVLQRVSQDTARELLGQCKKYHASALAQRICDQVVARFSKQCLAELLKELVAKSICEPD